jgi:hypothetical protein
MLLALFHPGCGCDYYACFSYQKKVAMATWVLLLIGWLAMKLQGGPTMVALQVRRLNTRNDSKKAERQEQVEILKFHHLVAHCKVPLRLPTSTPRHH